jgi:hypothetical protein
MVLRALLLKTQNPKAWTQLLEMESHQELREHKPNCIHADEKILINVQAFFPNEKELDEREIRRLSGIIDVNAHVLPQRVNGTEMA